MDHRWDRGAREGAAARREQERYGAPRIEHDPDVERRDRLVAMRPQQSPWEIGLAHYDQRDLYTRDSRIDAAGYGRGPNWHPEEGSYAYAREPRRPVPQPRTDATIFEREAWPWLNYHDVEEDPFQRDLHKRDSGFWDRRRGRSRRRAGRRTRSARTTASARTSSTSSRSAATSTRRTSRSP